MHIRLAGHAGSMEAAKMRRKIICLEKLKERDQLKDARVARIIVME
jgi:hypothetical protein